MTDLNFKTTVLLHLIAAVLILISCGGGGSDASGIPSGQQPGSVKTITAFAFPSVSATGAINQTQHTIAVTVPAGTAVTALSPVITHTGAGISPASGQAQNFTNPVTYTVTAEDASTQDYIVTVIIASEASGVKVAFVSLGGTLTPEQTVSPDGLATEPAAPTRSGYTFGGWYKTTKYDEAWNFASDTVSANTVLYPKWTRTNPETFLEADRPSVVLYDEGQKFYYGIRLPWNYDKPYNASRRYPLLIALHTGGGPMSTPTPPTNYTCLVLSPKLPDNIGVMWTDEALAWFVEIIEKVQTDYRIDTDRMYITGFSQGGVGTYQVANALYNYNGQVFAAISRAAGGSGSYYLLPDASLSKTCANLRIGLKDYSGTVTCIRNAYNLIKNHASNAGATEVSFTRVLGNYTGNVRLIVKDGKERARITEFPDMGHNDIYDSSIFPWLYNQSISE